jgi:hypothetical protein
MHYTSSAMGITFPPSLLLYRIPFQRTSRVITERDIKMVSQQILVFLSIPVLSPNAVENTVHLLESTVDVYSIEVLLF